MAEERGRLGPHRGREEWRCGRGDRLVERGREVLTEGAIIGVDTGAFGASVRLDVRRSIGLIARDFELRIGQRRGGRSGELDQRDNERQEPQV